MEQIPGMEAEAKFEKDPPAIDTVQRHRTGMYAFSGLRRRLLHNRSRPIFVWQGWQS